MPRTHLHTNMSICLPQAFLAALILFLLEMKGSPPFFCPSSVPATHGFPHNSLPICLPFASVHAYLLTRRAHAHIPAFTKLHAV